MVDVKTGIQRTIAISTAMLQPPENIVNVIFRISVPPGVGFSCFPKLVSLGDAVLVHITVGFNVRRHALSAPKSEIATWRIPEIVSRQRIFIFTDSTDLLGHLHGFLGIRASIKVGLTPIYGGGGATLMECEVSKVMFTFAFLNQVSTQ